MNLELELMQCARCGKIRERYLIGCPNCGTVETVKIDPNGNSNVFYEINLEVIKKGADFYKKELEDLQKRWLQRRIPTGMNWQMYAGIVLTNRLSMIWLKQCLPFEAYGTPLSITNSRVYYVMSYKTEEAQNNFCDFLNQYNPEKLEIADDEEKRNLQRKASQIDEDFS